MTWFKVDDSFHSHPKVLAADPAALGLWVVAGAWCSANLTDGFVPDYVLPRLLPDSARLAEMLTTCRLWKRTKGGYRFHDWSQYQPTKEEASAAKVNKSSGGALGNHRRWHVGTGKQNAHCPFCLGKPSSDNRSVSDRITDTGTESHPNPPTRPDPTLERTTTNGPSVAQGRNARRHEEPPESEAQPGPAEKIVTEWISGLRGQPPRRVVERIGTEVADALQSGCDPADVRAGLALWQQRGNLGAGVLPSLIHEITNGAPATPGTNVVAFTGRASVPRPSTTDDRVRTALDAGNRVAAQLAQGVNQ